MTEPIKPNSISGVTYSVADLDRTAEFYEALGFRVGSREDDRLTCYVNWFWLTFVAQDGDTTADKGAGVSLAMKVDDLDAYHEGVRAKGMSPTSEPRKRRPAGREFTLRDPDGYELVFFAKK